MTTYHICIFSNRWESYTGSGMPANKGTSLADLATYVSSLKALGHKVEFI